MAFNEIPWLKVITSIVAGSIAVIELWELRNKRKNIKWQRIKKPIIITASMALVMLSVWDTVKEENKNNIIENRRDIQIKADSIRLNRIFLKSGEILGRVETAVSGIDNSNSIMLELNGMAQETNQRLDIAIDKSKILVDLEQTRFGFEEPVLNNLATITEIKINNDNIIEKITYQHVNNGKRPAIIFSTDIVLILKLSDDNTFNLINWIHSNLKQTIPGNGELALGRFLNLKMPAEHFINTHNILYGIIKLEYIDSGTTKKEEENFVVTSSTKKSETIEYGNIDFEDNPALVKFLITNNLDNIFTKENRDKYLKE